MKNPYQIIFALVLSVSLAGVVSAADDEEVNYIELAAVLVQDGNYERAEAALLEVDLNAEAVDVPRYHIVYGLIHLNRSEPEAAKASFYKSIDEGLVDELTGKTPDLIYIYLAQVHFGLKEYQEAITSLEKAGETGLRLSSTFLMRAHAHWMLKQRDDTWAVLDDATVRFPANTGFLRRKVFYLIELSLFQEAADLGRVFLERENASEEDYLAIGNALRQAGELDEALKLLEVARLKFPQSEQITKVLAHTYLANEQTLAAAEMFFQASLSNPELVSEAAELYRRSGKLYRSLTLNAQISDQSVKLKQRLAILLELGQYDQVTAMEDAMFRAGLLEDEDLRYAVAYAYFQTGDYRKTESHLTKLTRPDLFRKATELRKAIEDCVSERWKCS